MEDMMDNSRLEQLIEIISEQASPEQESEVLEELKKSQLIMPVIYPEGIFGDFDNLKEGDVIKPKEQLGFDINYLSDDEGNRAIPLFTSSRIMNEVGLESSSIVMHAEDLANMFEGAIENYGIIIINPLSSLQIEIPTIAFINIFHEFDEEESQMAETLYGILEILENHSIELEDNTRLFLRSEYNFMKDGAVDGVFAPAIPLNASTREEFREDLPYLNLLLMEEGKKMVYVGHIVDDDAFDVIIAPGTEFELVDEIDEFTSVWKCGDQPFYDEE